MEKDTIRCDPVTAAWCKEHCGVHTTLVRCEKCGLFYKDALGHKCEVDQKEKTE